MSAKDFFIFAFSVSVVLFLSCRSSQPEGKIRTLEDFPFDQVRAHGGDFSPTGNLKSLSENLFRLEDCCNVYVIKSGSRAILIDFGSGEILDRLGELGVEKIDRVLVTHHHRDQVQGLCDLSDYSFQVSVPEKEARFFEDVGSFWRNVQIYINYDCRSHWNTIRKSIRVDRKVNAGDVIDWNGMAIKVIQTPGSTDGSVSYVAEVDGRRVVFCGDLIAGTGKVNNWFDLHWDYYGFTQGMDASLTSFERLRAENPDWLLPSHGEPIESPKEAMAANSRIYETLRHMLVPNELHRQKQEVRQILPHLVFVGANCYAVISESGKAFLYDYGYVNLESLWEFKDKFNVKQIDAVSFSHYHDDHNFRTYELLHERGKTGIWIYENMLDVFENPTRYRLPCLLPFPILADRVLHDGEKVQWEEYTLEFFHLPGQTEFHQGLFTVVDSKRVIFTGDNTWNKLYPDKRRNGPVVPHNEYFLDGGFITCAAKMLEYRPDIVCPAHTEEYFPTREDLEEFLGWAKELREVMTSLIDQPDPNFGMDYRWCRFYPYRSIVCNKEPFQVELMIRNHLFKPARVEVTLRHSPNIECQAPDRSFTIEAKKQVAVPFSLRKTGSFLEGREVITADIRINGCRIGEYAEALVDESRSLRKSD
ncbi:MAG TPA: MBL fold metallo-hydrolase [archaeon]|nr:MBL fold metallo-hydrolase [archaeon]